MEHVVFFPAHDGSPAFRRVASLEDAVRLVEHLRNTEGVDQVSVFSLTEVPLAFKAYYRVEVPAEEGTPAPEPTAAAAEEAPAPEAPAAEAAAAEAPQVAPPAVPEQEAPAAAEPQPSSLGFFAR